MSIKGETFGSYMRQCRLNKRLTFYALGKQIGLTPVQISDVERGISAPPMSETVIWAWSQAVHANIEHARWLALPTASFETLRAAVIDALAIIRFPSGDSPEETIKAVEGVLSRVVDRLPEQPVVGEVR